MKIDSSTVGMESARSYRATTTTIRKFTIMDYRQGLSGSGNSLNAAVGGDAENAGDTETKENTPDSGTGEEMVQQSAASLQDWQSRLQASGSNVTVRSSASQTYAAIRHTTISYIFNLLFSERRNRLNQWMQQNGIQTRDTQAVQTQHTQTQHTGQSSGSFGLYYQNGLAGSGDTTARLRVLNYSQAMIRTEAENTAFSTVGKVCTADGREIGFNVNVGMSRQFQQYYEQSQDLRVFTMCDPLVINLDTDMTELSDQTFYFDIDADGETDEISQLGAGSGYLALDKNSDGVINDGSELFGTASGNGFADLAKYDEDGNGWIDENDAVWDKLKIWCKDENGRDVLYRLSEKGVGAICLKNVSTDFTMQGAEGQTKGAVRSTSIFLYENGSAGTVQHVDVAKYSAQA